MAKASDTKGILLQNLIDAGCTKEVTETCMQLVKEKKKADTLRLLEIHKQELLDKVHVGQKQIDCLDFLVYRLRKEMN